VHQVTDELLRAFLQQPGWGAVGVGDDLPAGDICCVVVQAEVSQDGAADGAHVAGGVPQPDPSARRGPVQPVPAGCASSLFWS